MSAGLRWVIAPDSVFPAGAERYAAAIRSAVFQYCQYHAPQIEAWMKANAPWTDRSGNARQTLNAFAQEMAEAIVIELGHGVDYGKYLEWKNSGRFAIIAPALDEWGPRIMAGLRKLLA